MFGKGYAWGSYLLRMLHLQVGGEALPMSRERKGEVGTALGASKGVSTVLVMKYPSVFSSAGEGSMG